MAITRNSRSAFLVALLVAVILVSSSYSSKDDLREMKAVIEPMGLAKCEELAGCDKKSCRKHCFGDTFAGEGICIGPPKKPYCCCSPHLVPPSASGLRS